MGFKFSGDAKFSDGILRLNNSDEPDANVPSSLVGFTVHRGAASGVIRSLAGIFWDEAAQAWTTRFTDSTDAPLGGFLDVKFGAGSFTGVIKAGTSQQAVTDANGNLLASTLTGALPALDGSALTGVGGGSGVDEGLVRGLDALNKRKITALTARVAELESATPVDYTVVGTGTFSWTPGAITTNSASTLTAIAGPNALGFAFGDKVEVVGPGTQNQCILHGYIDNSGALTVSYANPTSSSQTPASGTFKYRVTRW